MNQSAKPNYVETDDPEEITLHVRDLAKTGSRRLELFSSRRGSGLAVGHQIDCAGRRYIIEKITEGRP